MTLDQRCGRCHEISTSMDVCSECGAPMADAPAPTPVVQAPLSVPPDAVGSDRVCPECQEPRHPPTARFCENCRWDFVAKKAFQPKDVPPVLPGFVPPPVPDSALPASQVVESKYHFQESPVASLSSSPTAPPPAAGGFVRWEVVAVADPSLCGPDDEAPADLRERRYPVDFDENLIGRRSDRDNIHPEIVIADRGVSKRHARIDRHPDGTLSVIDLDSTNGTKLNGLSLDPNVAYPVKNDDELQIGIFTRMKIRSR